MHYRRGPGPFGVDGTGLAPPATVASTFVIGVFWELSGLIAREAGERVDIARCERSRARPERPTKSLFDGLPRAFFHGDECLRASY
jgi:hypothetical protein